MSEPCFVLDMCTTVKTLRLDYGYSTATFTGMLKFWLHCDYVTTVFIVVTALLQLCLWMCYRNYNSYVYSCVMAKLKLFLRLW